MTFNGTIGQARAERRRLLAVRREPVGPVVPSVATLDDFAAHYLRAKAPVLAGATIRNREDDYRLRIAPILGSIPLEAISRERVEVWLADMAASATSRRMVVQTVATLRVILGAAVEWGRLPANPALRLRLPRPDADNEIAVERVLDRAQLAALIDAACPVPRIDGRWTLRVETIIRAAAEAGLRRGEVIGLRWPDVDLAARRIAVRRSVWQERATDTTPVARVEQTTKGGRSRRVAISPAFAERLAEWFAESIVGRGADANGYVWPGKSGPMDERSANRAASRAMVRAGLVDDDSKPLVTFHGCGTRRRA